MILPRHVRSAVVPQYHIAPEKKGTIGCVSVQFGAWGKLQGQIAWREHSRLSGTVNRDGVLPDLVQFNRVFWREVVGP
eukprot:COSAG02_NODE_2009_length_10124_cov_15.733566_6_plen_78_part_00